MNKRRVDSAGTAFWQVLTLLVLTPLSHAAALLEPTTWHSKPIPEQVPGSVETLTGHKLNVALWFNDTIDQATLTLDDFWSRTSGARILCGAAGQEGALLWQAGAAAPGRPGKHWEIHSEDLLSNNALEVCGVTVNNVAGLRTAANRRLLYVEYERSGQTHRGQLWPRELMSERVWTPMAIATPDQVAGAPPTPAPDKSEKNRVHFRISEYAGSLDRIGYFVQDDGKEVTAALYCAPPGHSGERLAELNSGRGRDWQWLEQTDIRPVGQTSSCGMAINSVASLVEALLRGHLYTLIERPDGSRLRGQIPVRSVRFAIYPNRTTVELAPIDIASGGDSPKDGIFERFINPGVPSLVDNGFGEFSIGVEFAPGHHAGSLLSVTLQFEPGSSNTPAKIEIYGYSGDGTVTLEDIGNRSNLLGTVSGGPGINSLDVTGFVRKRSLVGFALKEARRPNVNGSGPTTNWFGSFKLIVVTR